MYHIGSKVEVTRDSFSFIHIGEIGVIENIVFFLDDAKPAYVVRLGCRTLLVDESELCIIEDCVDEDLFDENVSAAELLSELFD